MIAKQSILIPLIALYNFMFIAACATCVKLFIQFAGVRKFVKDAIENGDDRAHHEDANKAVILTCAIGAAWMIGNLIFLDALFGPSTEWHILVGTAVAGLLGLLGLKKFT